MELFSNAYFNFFSIGSLIPLIFMLLVSSFLLLIRNKSEVTLWMGLSLLALGLYYLPYFPASTFFHPAGAYHRWGTVFFILMAGVFLSQMFFHFPENTHPRTARAFFIVQWLLAVIVSGVFIAVTKDAGRVYHFDGHYWDFDADRASSIVGAVIMLDMAVFLSVGLWRFITIKTKERWTVLGMTLALASPVPPGITNMLSRDGAIGRDVHQTLMVLLSLAGLFALIIIHVNTTKDRTSFMAKIVGISLVTFLLVLQFVSYFSLLDKEEAYDEVRRVHSKLALKDEYRGPADLRYIAVFALDRQEGTFLRRDEQTVPDPNKYKTEFLNTALRERIMTLDAMADKRAPGTGAPDKRDETPGTGAPDKNGRLSPAEFRKRLNEMLEQSHPGFAGYRRALAQYASELKPDDVNLAHAVFRRLDANHRTILYRMNKIRKLPNEGFRQALEKFLKGQTGEFAPFREALEELLKKSDSRDASLKAEALDLLQPVHPAGKRIFRKHEGPDLLADNYVGFMQVDLKNNQAFEVGYSYRTYRQFIHSTALQLTVMLGLVIAVVLFGFRFFFQGSLVSPLDDLLGGVEQVNAGDLNVQVPIRVADEIGFLAGSFNAMVASIGEARRKLQDYADNLEARVRERTAELRQTLEKVQQLKEQQDGDYFLTSLLIKPLAANRADSPLVNVTFLVRQKKSFHFRKWKEEIGGDLNKAHRITLHGKKFTVFLNADAMGKSMQGAGGVLVLGSVFESLLERTLLSQTTSDQYPERWLKNAFIELQKIFESFDGSMYVSLVMGLVDEESGLMYFINAEHPFTVLYRAGKAAFIENELTFRKLGTAGMEGKIFVKTFQLEPGDVIIVGSDGRDDLLLGLSRDGSRRINEDETAFLARVEEGDGILKRIYRMLLSQGRLTDDLSLLRIGYREDTFSNPAALKDARIEAMLKEAKDLRRGGNAQEATEKLERILKMAPESPEVYYELVRIHLERQEYLLAASYAEDYAYLRPGDTEVVYIASVCFRKAGNLKRAADLGERVRLREPHLLKNVLNLSKIYLGLENFDRADMLADEALLADPDNSMATQIKLRISEFKNARSDA